MSAQPRPALLLDTSPLITLCAFQAQGLPLALTMLRYADLYITEQIAAEALAEPPHADIQVIKPLLETRQIAAFRAPAEPAILEVYTKLSQADRSVIRLALASPTLQLVIDEREGYVVATRCGLKPLFLLDALVELARHHGLDVRLAKLMVQSVQKRYSAGFVAHTLAKLDEVNHEQSSRT